MSPGPRDPQPEMRAIRRPWRSALVLVCRECQGSKGFGPKAVAKALRRVAKPYGGAKAAKVVTVSCLDVCPRRSTCVVAIGDVATRAVRLSEPGGARTLIAAVLADEAQADQT